MEIIKVSVDIKQVSTEALAYLGDCVIELKVRTLLVERGISDSGNLNKGSLDFVKATSQAKAMRNIIELLTEDEATIYKRGRNMSGGRVPKSATMSDYRSATGMEVLFGYLHITGRNQRIDELFALAYPAEEQNEV